MPDSDTVLVLLPGMDGTGELFEPFLRAKPVNLGTEVIEYPRRMFLDYDALEEYVAERLPEAERLILLGESYSGPLALQMAGREPEGLLGVILVATFVRPPLPAFIQSSLLRRLLQLPPQTLFLRKLLTGYGAGEELIPKIQSILTEIPREVWLKRLESIFRVDATEALKKCKVPILYIRALRDRVVRRRNLHVMNRIRADIARCDVDAPHMVLQVAPRESWTGILNFIEQLEES